MIDIILIIWAFNKGHKWNAVWFWFKAFLVLVVMFIFLGFLGLTNAIMPLALLGEIYIWIKLIQMIRHPIKKVEIIEESKTEITEEGSGMTSEN